MFSLAALCGLQSVPTWGRDNRNQNRSLVPAWTQEEIDVVREVYSWDFALYEWALSRFTENLRTLQFKPALDRYKDACAGEYKDRLDARGRLLEHGPATRIVVTRASGPSASAPGRRRPATSRRSRVGGRLAGCGDGPYGSAPPWPEVHWRLNEVRRRAGQDRSSGSTTARISSGIGTTGRAGSVLSTYTCTKRPSAAASAASPWNSPTR